VFSVLETIPYLHIMAKICGSRGRERDREREFIRQISVACFSSWQHRERSLIFTIDSCHSVTFSPVVDVQVVVLTW